jgi:hypothetical protein
MAQEFKIKNGVIVSGSADVEQDITVNGLSKFGNSLNDTHQFTGSIEITGSIMLNGEPLGTGKLDETTFESFTSSYTTGSFTGSFNGDGTNLFNIPASGVTGLNLTQISDGSVTASVSNTNGLRINSKTEITGSLTVTEGITGSIDYLNIINVPTLVSGSSQINITGTTGYSTFSSSVSSSISDISSSIATTDLNQNNRLNSIENVTGSYATTGSNLFKGTQTHSGSILPSVDNAYDLGSADYQWRDVYISSGSLYIDGTKVISSTAQELTITTDTGQSIKILEGTTDSIILQTADGDIELKSSADGDILLDPTNGKIMLKGPIEIFNGNKIQSSVGGTPVVFANDIVISGSIDLTGTIEGIDLTDFSSSVNTRLSNLESADGNLNTFTASAINRLSAIEISTGSLNTFTSSINTTIKSKLNGDGVISGSSQVILTGTTGYSTFSSSVATSVNDLSSSMNSLSSSFSLTDTSHNNRLTTIEGRYVTTGSNIFKGDQTITGSLYISQNLIVQGSSSLENITASAVSIGTNTIILNADTPAIRYAGISVFDSGSTNVTASLFYDSLTNNWKFQHSDVGTDDASILLYGPLGTGIDNAPTLVGNFLTKVEDNSHGHHLTTSSIFDNGSKISLKNNTEITGSVIITSTIVSQGTTLVSGSGQISYTGIINIPSGIVSGSSQITPLLPAGTVSGSSQVLNGTTIHSGSFFNGISVVSGSGQISFNGITDKPTLVSGSSQVSFTGLSSIPGGLVSGSSQVDLTATSNYSSGIKTRLNAEGVISGSSQVVLTSGQVTTALGYTPYNSTNPNGYTTNTGTVTSVGGTGTVSGLSLSGTVTTSGNITLGGTLTLTSGQITTGLGYTPYNSTNPNGYISSYTETDTLATVTSRGAITSTLITLSKTNSTLYNPNAYNGGTGQLSITSTINSTGVYNGIRFAGGSGSHEGFFGTVQNSSGLAEFIFQTFNGSAYGERTRITSKGSLLHGHAVTPSEDAWLGTAVFGRDSYNKVIIGSLNSSSIGAYIGGHNSALSAWADLNIAGHHLIFRYEQTERARFDTAGHFIPGANNTYNLGSASLGWANVYTNDLHLSNMNKPEGNDIDGTKGTWTIQEGLENLYIINNNNGKKFKIILEEV